MFGPSKRDLLRLIEKERAQHRLELGTLLDRLANHEGRPWTPAPADTPQESMWTHSPEQEPIT